MNKPKVLVAVPCMATIPYETVVALMNIKSDRAELHLEFISGSLVYDSRNEFCSMAVKGNYDYIMFIDSDMVFPGNIIDRLMALDADIATAVCYGKVEPHNPQVYTEMKPTTWYRKKTISQRPASMDGVFKIKACGMACCLVSVGLVKEMFRRNINPFEPFGHLGEDFAFCVRAHKLGAVMLADGSINIGHIGREIFTKEHWRKD